MENQCTMAETNILFIQEHFNPKTDDFHRVTQLAKRWGAAVELLRLIPKKGTYETPQEDIRPEPLSANHKDSVTYTGGVEDDGPEINTDNGLSETLEELVSMGRSAGGYTVAGAGREVINTVKENNNYSLVILGDLFLSKGPQTSTRLTRELGLTLHDKLRAPVIFFDCPVRLRPGFYLSKTHSECSGRRSSRAMEMACSRWSRSFCPLCCLYLRNHFRTDPQTH
ncbi:MAG: hypothetical protein JRJ39_16145 [Deltaproteobacteria bacterium]|nr:hypothetical protein [Deltaproteobacteria bacterium]